MDLGGDFQSFAQNYNGPTMATLQRNAPTPQVQAKAPTKSGSGGIMGFLYHNLVQPTVKSAEAVPGDLVGYTKALGQVGGGILEGKTGSALQASKQAALNDIRGTTAGKSLPSTVKGVQQQSAGKALEQAAGNIGNQALNLSAPIGGGEEMAGKEGLKALVGAGIKTGAKFGAIGGATNAMAGGESGNDILGGAAKGALAGGVVGGAGGILGATASKLAGGKLSSAADNNAGGLLAKTAAKRGANEMTQQVAAERAPFSIVDSKVLQGSRNAQGQQVGLAATQSLLRKLGMDTGPAGLHAFSDLTTGAHGMISAEHQNILDNAGNVDVSGINAKVSKILENEHAELGGVGSGGAADKVNKSIQNMLKGNLTPGESDTPQIAYDAAGNPTLAGGEFPGKAASASNVFKTVQGLNKAMGNVNMKADSGPATRRVYGAVRDALQDTLNSSGVNKTVADHKLAPQDEAAIRATVQTAGQPDSLGDYIVNSINNSKSSPQLSGAQQPGVVAGHIADAFDTELQGVIPQLKDSANQGNWTNYSSALEAAGVMHNPFQAIPLAFKAAKSGPVQRLAGALNPGARAAGADEAATALGANTDPTGLPGMQPAAESTAPAPVQPPPAPPVPTQVPVNAEGAGQATPIPTTTAPTGFAATPFAQQNPHVAAAVAPLVNGASAVANGVSSLADEARNSDTAALIGKAVQAPGQIKSAISSPQGVRALTGALTGNATVQAGNGNMTAAGPSQSVPGNLDTSQIDQVGQAADAEANQGSTSTEPSQYPLANMEADVAADPTHASIYEDYYKFLQTQDAGPKLSATQQKNVTNLRDATVALSTYVQGLNSLSSSTRGVGVGSLSALLGKFGLGGADATTAARLESQKEELAVQLATAINNGTKPQAAVIAGIKGQLPSVGDPKSLADQKIDSLTENLQGYLGIGTGAQGTYTGTTGSQLQALQGQ
jgi:hypothetical protein